MYEFEERPSNLIVGFAATEVFIRKFVKNPFTPCNIRAHIKDSRNQKVFEIKRDNEPIMTCINPLLAFSDVKLGIRYRRIIPQFRSLNKANRNSDF